MESMELLTAYAENYHMSCKNRLDYYFNGKFAYRRMVYSLQTIGGEVYAGYRASNDSLRTA